MLEIADVIIEPYQHCTTCLYIYFPHQHIQSSSNWCLRFINQSAVGLQLTVLMCVDAGIPGCCRHERSHAAAQSCPSQSGLVRPGEARRVHQFTACYFTLTWNVQVSLEGNTMWEIHTFVILYRQFMWNRLLTFWMFLMSLCWVTLLLHLSPPCIYTCGAAL